MSILGNILGRVFNRNRDDKPAAAPAAPTKVVTPEAKAAPLPKDSAPAAVSEVDVEAQLDGLNAGKGLNWRTSIVDLMKLVGMESSLAERKELADELGYTGDKSDSATMNIWLHKQVLQRIAANGGRVPANLLD